MGSNDISLESSVYGSASQSSGAKRQFANMEYTTGVPVTGNISLELLKQSQNTKFLLGQGQGRLLHESSRQAHDMGNNPGSTTNLSLISEGSSSVTSQYPLRSDINRFKGVC